MFKSQKADNDVKKYKKKFICLDKEDLYVQGDFNSKEASLFSVMLVKC